MRKKVTLEKACPNSNVIHYAGVHAPHLRDPGKCQPGHYPGAQL